MRCVDLYNQAQSKWFEEMVTSGLVNTMFYYNFFVHVTYKWELRTIILIISIGFMGFLLAIFDYQ